MTKNRLLKITLLFFISSSCQAHTSQLIVNGWWHGLLHPLTGVDHLFTLVAIGMLATRNTQYEKPLLPLVFLLSMVLGFIFSISGQTLAFVEQAIAVSAIILGGWLVSSKQLNDTLLLFIASGVAIAHGYAHGTEVVGSTIYYLSGFVASAVLLILVTLLAFRYASPVKNKIQSLFGMIVSAVGFIYLLQG